MTHPSRTKAYSRRYDKLRRAGYRLTTDGLVTRRKLAALQAIGWSLTEIAECIGMTQQSLSHIFHSDRPVHLKTERAVAEVYDDWHMTPNTTRYAPRTRAYAKRQGHASPFAWDDINERYETPKGMTA